MDDDVMSDVACQHVWRMTGVDTWFVVRSRVGPVGSRPLDGHLKSPTIRSTGREIWTIHHKWKGWQGYVLSMNLMNDGGIDDMMRIVGSVG
jgi:hypothetical protein